MTFLRALHISAMGGKFFIPFLTIGLIFAVLNFIETYFLETIKSVFWILMLFSSSVIVALISNGILNRWMRQTTLVTLLVGWCFSFFVVYSAIDLTIYAIDRDELSSSYIIFKLTVLALFFFLSIFLSRRVQIYQPSGNGAMSLFVACIPALFFFTLSLYRIIDTCITGTCTPFNPDLLNIHTASNSLIAFSIAIFIFFMNYNWEERTMMTGGLSSLLLLILYVVISPKLEGSDRVLVGLCSTFIFSISAYILSGLLRGQGELGIRDSRGPYIPLLAKFRILLTENIKKFKTTVSLVFIAGAFSIGALTLPPYFLTDRTISNNEIRDRINKKLPVSEFGIKILSIKTFNLMPTGRATMALVGEAKRYGGEFPISISASFEVRSNLEDKVIYIRDLQIEEFKTSTPPGALIDASIRRLKDQTKFVIKRNFSATVYDFSDNLYDSFLSRFVTEIDINDGLITVIFNKP